MLTILFIVSAIVSVGIAWSTFIQTYRQLWQPRQTIISTREYHQWSVGRRWRYYAEMIGSFIGVAYCIYKGVEGALWWIPQSWRVTDENGETEWVVHGLAFTIAIYGAILLLGKLDEITKDRAARLAEKSVR